MVYFLKKVTKRRLVTQTSIEQDYATHFEVSELPLLEGSFCGHPAALPSSRMQPTLPFFFDEQRTGTTIENNFLREQ